MAKKWIKLKISFIDLDYIGLGITYISSLRDNRHNFKHALIINLLILKINLYTLK